MLIIKLGKGELRMEQKLCEEKHKNIDGIIKKHEERLDEHDTKIEKLEVNNATNTMAIDNLCIKISDLVGVLKWLIGLGGTSLVGFFIYAIQSHIFK
jgi:cytidylate kinase